MNLGKRKNQKILPRLVVVDGFSNSGKSLVAPILGYLEGGENWVIDYKYEQIAAAEYLRKIDKNSAMAIVENWLDSDIYDILISRKANFRKPDMSSIYTSGMEELYLKRIEKKDGDYIIDEIEKSRSILPLHLHYVVGFSDIFLDLSDLHIITLRDPIILIKKWYENNWDNKIGLIKRQFTLCIEDENGHKYPWFTKDYLDKFKQANDIEKSILIVYYFHKKMYEMTKNRDNVLFIKFNEFLENPLKFVEIFEDRLQAKRKDDFDKILNILKLPRIAEKEISYENFMNEFKVSKNYVDKIEQLLSWHRGV